MPSVVETIRQRYESSNTITFVSFGIFVAIAVMTGFFFMAIFIAGVGITVFYNSLVRYAIYVDPGRPVRHRLALVAILIGMIWFYSYYLIMAYALSGRLLSINENVTGYDGEIGFYLISGIPTLIFIILGLFIARKYPMKKVDMALYKRMHRIP